MHDYDPTLDRTGIHKIDNVSRARSRKGLLNKPLIKDPTAYADGVFDRTSFLNSNSRGKCTTFKDIDKAYDVDSFVRQGVDKYVELCVKHGWRLDCATREPVDYLKHRLLLMGLMTGNCFDETAGNLVWDFIAYGNAFLIKKRQKPPEDIPGLPVRGAGKNTYPILGYFRADPKKMSPIWSKDKRQLQGWELSVEHGKPIEFKVSEVIHFPYNRKPGELWGNPTLQPVLEDVRAYRRCEEYVIRLLFKHLNPLLHHMVPDLTSTGTGRQEDVDLAALTHQILAPDGWVITPPGHKIEMIGAESHALRGEGYLTALLERVWAGLGVNSIVMGSATGAGLGSADVMTANMHNKAKYYQHCLARMLTDYVLYELLIEGGYNPLQVNDQVSWVWHEIEIETQIKRENHAIQLWTNGLLDIDESRQKVGFKPMRESQEKRTHVYLTQIPKVEAQAAASAARFANKDGPADQSKSRDRPSNQHGDRGAPKIRPK